MATPTRSQMASTPKNPTPGRTNASPRPNLGAFGNKTTAGKSPAVKTPASFGHAHRISVSSHPISTPLAASALPDDILNMNTPAALMASMGPTGYTPAAAADGLGINTIDNQGGQDGQASKNPQKERHDRLRAISTILKKKARGRGVTRDNIQTMARIHGFDPLWQDNILTFAGEQYVELEMEFDDQQKDVVKKATLTLNDPASEEGTVQADASEVLSRNLNVNPHADAVWHDLSDFQQNLAYLSYLERIPTTDCFKVIDNLYDTFRTIYAEEKKRTKWRHEMHHLCEGNVGKVQKDKGRKLGVSVKYWTRGDRFYMKEEPKLTHDEEEQQDWTVRFSIGKGQPSMSASQKWLGKERLTSSARAEDIFQESAVDRPAWEEASNAVPAADAEDGNAMDVDQRLKIDDKLDIHFTCELEPPIVLSGPAVANINKSARMIDWRPDELMTFQQSVLTSAGINPDPNIQWSRRQFIFGRDGKQSTRMHSFSLYTGNVWACNVDQFIFTHPKQFAEVLPVLRQYALVNTLLNSIAPDPKPVPSTNSPPQQNGNVTNEHKSLTDRRKVTRRSNKPKAEAELDAVMNPVKALDHGIDRPLPIDIRLDTHTSTVKSCRLEILLPLSEAVMSPSTLARWKAQDFLKILVDVLLNGTVEIPDIEGIQMEKQRAEELRKQLARVFRASEDIGMVVSWLLRELNGS